MLRDLSFAHIFILMAIVLLVFGAKRIPEIGSSLGKGIKEFKKSMSEIGDTTGNERTTLPPADHRVESTPTHESGEPKRLSD